MTSAASSTSAPPSGAGIGQNHLCGSAYRVDHRHRRHAPARDARGGELAVPDHREIPSAVAVGARRDELGDRASARSR